MVLSPSVPLLPQSVCRTASALVSPPSEVVTSVAFRRRRKKQQQEVSGWRWGGRRWSPARTDGDFAWGGGVSLNGEICSPADSEPIFIR